MNGQDEHRERWTRVAGVAAATAAVVGLQHILAFLSDLTFWGPYGAGGEEIPPLDIALSAWFLGAGAAVLTATAISRRWLPPTYALPVVLLVASTTALVALVLQNIPFDGFDGGLSWAEVLVPHAAAVLLGSLAGAFAAAHDLTGIPIAAWSVLWGWTAAAALEGTNRELADTLMLLPLVVSALLIALVAGRARWHGASRLPVLFGIIASAVLPLVAFALAQQKLLPDPQGFEVDDTHLVALIWAGFVLVLGALAALAPVDGQRRSLPATTS